MSRPAESRTAAGSAICRDVRSRRGRSGFPRTDGFFPRGPRVGTISTIPWSATTPIRTHDGCRTPDAFATFAGMVIRRKLSIVRGPVGSILLILAVKDRIVTGTVDYSAVLSRRPLSR